MTVNLKSSPYFLSDEKIKWVESSIQSMPIEEKIGQLFFLMAADDNSEYLSYLSSIKPGGVMLRPMAADRVLKAHNELQEQANIPLFLAANLEAGGNGLIEEGTAIGHPLLVAATDDAEFSFKQGETCMRESKSLGGNMAFAPILDLNYNWENPIANIRCFGDDVERVSQMTRRYVDAVQEQGGFVTIKHFPGDGTDGRDQHVIKTINNLNYADWKETFGKVYQDNIDNHATGLMVGHIALPSYFEENGIVSEDKLVPASLSNNLLEGLLRKELGFNGLVMTDATQMTGFGAEGKRKDLLPECIAAGNDMILFTRDLHEDYGFVMEGYKKGVITDERLHDALMRILGLKAKENMHTTSQISLGDKSSIGCELHKNYAAQVADNGVTLVRNDENILPLDSNKSPKIGIISLGNEKSMMDAFEPDVVKKGSHEKFGEQLRKRGFEIEFIDHSDPSTMMQSATQSIESFTESYDAIIYFVKKDTKSNQTNLRVEFKSPIGFDAPWFVHEVPTILVSVANPYHQYDFENVRTVINGYSPTDEVFEAIASKLVGESEFKGVSPVKLQFAPFTGSIEKWK